VPRSIARIRSAFRPSACCRPLAVEALNDLPAKHGKRPNVKNPLLDHRERPHLPASETRIPIALA
jgi:hypothetical protein